MNKKHFILILFLGIMLKFFVGVYSHDEFGGTHLFVKHKPTWKWKFYSPIGMSDIKMSDLSVEKQKEQLLFNEYISNRGLSK